MRLSQKIAVNTFIQTVGKLLFLAISLFAVVLLTRYLGVEGYGYYTTVFAYIGLLSVISEFNINSALQREMGRREKTGRDFFAHTFALKALFALIVLSLGIALAYFINYPLEVKRGVLITGIAVYFLILDSTLTVVFQIHLKMIFREIATILGRVVFIVALVIFIKLNLNILYIFSASLAGNLITFIIALAFSKKIIKIGFKYNLPYFKKIFLEIAPLGMAGILMMFSFKIDSIMLFLMKGAYDAGIYGAPYKIIEVLRAFPPMFMGLAIPILSKHYLKDQDSYLRIFKKTFNFLSFVAIPIVIFLFVFAVPIMDLVAGKEFKESSLVLVILTFPLLFLFLHRVLLGPIIAAKKYKQFFYISVVALVFNIVANILVIPKYSYIGAAYTTLFTELLKFLLFVSVLKLKENLDIPWKKLFRLILIALPLLFFYLWIFKHNILFNWSIFPSFKAVTQLLILIAVAASIFLSYSILTYFFAGINKESLALLFKKEKETNN